MEFLKWHDHFRINNKIAFDLQPMRLKKERVIIPSVEETR